MKAALVAAGYEVQTAPEGAQAAYDYVLQVWV
jgi:uncharacterized protein YbdZ (MbtH family)